jgi:hypothetical protein
MFLLFFLYCNQVQTDFLIPMYIPVWVPQLSDLPVSCILTSTLHSGSNMYDMKLVRRTNSAGCFRLTSTSHLEQHQRFGNRFCLHHQDRYNDMQTAVEMELSDLCLSIAESQYVQDYTLVLPYPCVTSATNIHRTTNRPLCRHNMTPRLAPFKES